MKKKICFAASSGGHLQEIAFLKGLMEKYPSFLITEKVDYKNDNIHPNVYYIKQINRKEKSFPVLFVLNIINSFVIFLKEKPNVVITTGALSTVPICLIVKLFGGKLIYIESYAKINSVSMTGKLLYPFADRFYVQWESMLEHYPKAIYVGGLY